MSVSKKPTSYLSSSSIGCMSRVESVRVALANSKEPGGVVTLSDAINPADNPVTIPATAPKIFFFI